MVKVAVGQADEFLAPDALKGASPEFISLFRFVFIGASSRLVVSEGSRRGYRCIWASRSGAGARIRTRRAGGSNCQHLRWTCESGGVFGTGISLYI